FRMAIQKISGVRDERRALPAEGHIPRTKTADRSDPRARSNNRWLANLQRGRGLRTETGNGPPLMENGLAVASDQRDASRQHVKFTASGESCLGEESSQTKIQLAKRASADGVLFRNAKNFLAKRVRKFDRCVGNKLGVQIWRRSGDAREGHVNPIGRRAGHHAEDEHVLFAHEICFFSSARRLSASSGFNWSRSAPRSFSSTSRSRAVK